MRTNREKEKQTKKGDAWEHAGVIWDVKRNSRTGLRCLPGGERYRQGNGLAD